MKPLDAQQNAGEDSAHGHIRGQGDDRSDEENEGSAWGERDEPQTKQSHLRKGDSKPANMEPASEQQRHLMINGSLTVEVGPQGQDDRCIDQEGPNAQCLSYKVNVCGKADQMA